MDNFSSYLDLYKQMIDNHIASIKRLLTDDHIKQLGWEFMESKNSQPKDSFNVFTLASNRYYLENFHSDIIMTFLDPTGNHNEGTTFLFAFIDFLNNNFADKVSIFMQNYSTAKVERENGKIDILISSEATKHCIIVENKMHDAVDMQRQLPRYYDFMKSQEYTIDAIVYLPLNKDKRPDQSTWNEQDKENVLPRLCIVPAYQKSDLSLVTGWILPCSLLTKNIDCISVLRQYGDLIIKLSNNIMDNVILEKFFNSLLEGDNFKTAQSIRNMLNELPMYMKDRIKGKLESRGLKPWLWPKDHTHCGILYNKDNDQYKIDIWSSENGYRIDVFVQDKNVIDTQWSDEIINALKEFGFHKIGWAYEKSYSLTQEESVINQVEALAKFMEEMLQ